MSDLSRSLVDAAAEAIEAVILAKCPPNVMPTLPPGCTGKDLGEGAVAAVLETLAAETRRDWQAIHEDMQATEDRAKWDELSAKRTVLYERDEWLRRLAAEARTED